jgi:hypothetical protein
MLLYPIHYVRMDIDLKYQDQGCYSIPFTKSGWILTLNTKTQDVFFTGLGWILTMWFVILCVVSDHDGYYQVLQVMTKDLLSLASNPWWILSFSKDYDQSLFSIIPWQWRVLPFICNIMLLYVLDTPSFPSSCLHFFPHVVNSSSLVLAHARHAQTFPKNFKHP